MFPNVLAIIPALNLSHYTDALLRSLYRCPELGLKKLLLVDSGSTDDTPEVMARWQETLARRWQPYLNGQLKLEVEIVRAETPQSFAWAVNRGILRATKSGLDLCVFNNDMLVREDWLFGLQRCLATHQRWGMISSSLVPQSMTPEEFWITPLGTEPQLPPRIVPRIYDLPWLFRRECLQDVGLFDENFEKATWEDHDYLLRMVGRGWEFGRSFNSYCYHHWNKTQLDVQQREGHGYFQANRAYFIKKHGTDSYQSLLSPVAEEFHAWSG